MINDSGWIIKMHSFESCVDIHNLIREKKPQDVLMLEIKVLKIIRDTDRLLMWIPNNHWIWNLALNPFYMLKKKKKNIIFGAPALHWLCVLTPSELEVVVSFRKPPNSAPSSP